MERSKFGKFLDNVAIGVLIFFLSYLTAKKYLISKISSLILSVFILLILMFIICKIQNKKYKKLGLKKSEQKQIEQLNFFLKSQQKAKQNAILKQIFINDYLSYKNQFIILKNQVAILNRISKNQADEEDVFLILSHIDFLEKNNIKEVSIICSKYDKNINTNFLKNNNIEIIFITPDILFSIAKNNNYNFSETEKTQISHKFNKIQAIFSKNHAKYFLRTSMLLYIFSIIIPYSKHYLYFATASLFMSLVILIFGKSNKHTQIPKILEKQNISTK